MPKKYVFVRMPDDVFAIYKGLQFKLQGQINQISGKNIPLTMPKVFKAVVNPEINKNFNFDINELKQLARRKHE